MDVFTLALETKTASKSGGHFYPNSKKLERVGKSDGLAVKMRKNNYKRKERKRQKRFCRFFLLGGRCE